MPQLARCAQLYCRIGLTTIKRERNFNLTVWEWSKRTLFTPGE